MKFSSNLLPLSRFFWGTILLFSLWPTSSSAGCHLSRQLRTYFHEKRPGCQTRVEVKFCRGHCDSNTINEINEVMGFVMPMAKEDCRCCKATKPVMLTPKLLFRCRNGDHFRQKVWLPTPIECGCVHCAEKIKAP